MVYSSNQVKVLWPYVDKIRRDDKEFPQWFVLGGPANGDEAQRLKAKYPHTTCLAVEPSSAMVEYQRTNGFPGEVVQAGLCNKVGVGEITIVNGSERNSSMVWDIKGELVKVSLTTVDALDYLYGPVDKGILWLDIEGMELEALRGAIGCFERGAFRLVNVEVNDDYPFTTRRIHSFLSCYGLERVKTWDNQGRYHNHVYAMREKTYA